MKMKNNATMKTAFAISLTTLLGLTVLGTQQLPDEIVYNGKSYELDWHAQRLPMEDYFEKHPDERRKLYQYGMSTGLYRGHIAVYEVKDNQLYLKDLRVIAETEIKNNQRYIKGTEILVEKATRKERFRSALTEIFPNQEVSKIDWVTGLLILDRGNVILEFDKGKLVKAKQLSPEDRGSYYLFGSFMDRQFEVFKETDECKTLQAYLRKKESVAQTFIVRCAGQSKRYTLTDAGVRGIFFTECGFDQDFDSIVYCGRYLSPYGVRWVSPCGGTYRHRFPQGGGLFAESGVEPPHQNGRGQRCREKKIPFTH